MSFKPIQQLCKVAKHFTYTRPSYNGVSFKNCFLFQYQRTITTGQLRYNERTANDSISNGKQRSHDDSMLSFTPVYRFKYIVPLKVLARLKIYQTALMVVALPPSCYLYNTNAMSTEVFLSTLGISSLACIMLFVISFKIRKVVGMLSLKGSGDTVKISHLTFWGKRNDIICDVSDIVPLADMSENAAGVFVRLKRYSTNSELHLFLRHGQITDVRKLEDMIGSVK